MEKKRGTGRERAMEREGKGRGKRIGKKERKRKVN